MDKKAIISALKKHLKIEVGSVKDEWKTPSVVWGEDEKGIAYIETRVDSREAAIEMRDKVKEALKGCNLLQGYVGYDSVKDRFWQHLTIQDDITNKN
jgi:hypothetical protein